MLNNRLSIKTARGLYFANPKKVLTLTEKICKSYISVAIGSRRAIIIRLIGCDGKASLVGETADGRLPTLNFGDARETSMRFLLWERWSCSLKFDSSSYMTCNGTKRAFTQQYLNVVPSLLTMTRASVNERYFLRINTGVNGSNILRGKILNLYIECGGIVPIVETRTTIGLCLPFKLQGTESCPVNAPPRSSSSTILPTRITRVTDSPAIILKATSEVFVTSGLPTLTSPSGMWCTGTRHTPVNAPTSSISSTTLPTKTTRVTESPAINQRPHTRTTQQTRAAPTAFASSWCSHITPERSLNNPSTTFTTTIPPPLTKVSQTSASATEYARQVSDHPLESSVDNTPKPSYESSTTVLTSLTLKVSSSTEMSNVSSKTSTVLDLQPTLSSSRVSVVTPRAPGSSLVSNSAPKKFVIFPTTSNGTPRVEVSSKSSTVSIPPNVGTGRKGDNYGLYIGISTGITAFVILTFIIIVHLSYRHQRLKMRHNQESSARNSSTSMATERTVDEVTESPNDNSNVDGDYEHVYAVLRTDKREQAIYSSTYSVPVRECQGSNEEGFYDDVMPPKCEPASENNEPIDNELTVVKITQESFHTGSAQSKVLNNTKSREVGLHCYQNYPKRPMYINLQELPVNGSLENNSDSKVSYYNLH
ncbi:uncharacterized protein [Montipora foliosa]|uniref:uncharacterized protein isoform X2 n=1 Tax=Montipora foliosa TaxID=591990 RepID=UPI0035F19F4F